MTTQRDPDRMIQAFVREGAEQLQDQVYDVVRANVEQKRQRVVIGPWRVPTVSKLVPIGLGAAAVVAVLFLGARFIGPPTSSVGGPAVEATPTPRPSEASEPSDPRRNPVGGLLPEGPYLVQDVGGLADTPFITVTIPAPGWTSIPDFGGLSKGPDEDPPQSAMLLWAWPVGTAFDVYGDPCHWKSTRPATPATTVDEIAAALAAQTSRDASDPIDVTFVEGTGPDGYIGKKITLHVPNDAPTRAEAFADCDDDTFATYGVAGASTPNRYQQGPGQVDELWILNVNQAVVIIDVMYRPDTPAALIEEMRTIAESATFGW